MMMEPFGVIFNIFIIYTVAEATSLINRVESDIINGYRKEPQKERKTWRKVDDS